MPQLKYLDLSYNHLPTVKKGTFKDLPSLVGLRLDYNSIIGKKHALKKYYQFALNTICFWGSTGSNITEVCAISRIFCYKNNE